MSTSQFVARFNLSSVSSEEPSFDLYATGMDILSGDLSLYRPIKVDRLMARGVDGTRTRRRHRQFDDLVLRLVEPLPAGQTFSDRESAYRRAEGRVGGLSVRVNGQTIVWARTVAEIALLPDGRLPTALIGYGAVSGSVGTIIAQWTFMRLDEGTIG